MIIGSTQSVSIPFLFLFFFHQSSLYPIKIFAKCFYLLIVKLKHFLTFAEPEDEIFDQVAKEILEKSGVDTSPLCKYSPLWSYAGYLNSWPTV